MQSGPYAQTAGAGNNVNAHGMHTSAIEVWCVGPSSRTTVATTRGRSIILVGRGACEVFLTSHNSHRHRICCVDHGDDMSGTAGSMRRTGNAHSVKHTVVCRHAPGREDKSNVDVVFIETESLVSGGKQAI